MVLIWHRFESREWTEIKRGDAAPSRASMAWAAASVSFLVQERGEEAIEVMRMVKAALDPVGILNPGKLLPEG